MTGRGSGGKKRSKTQSRSARSGVLFPVGRIDRYLRKTVHRFRISAAAPVYLSAVIEYLSGNFQLRNYSQPICDGMATHRPSFEGRGILFAFAPPQNTAEEMRSLPLWHIVMSRKLCQ